MNKDHPASTVRFGPFQFDAERGELRREGHLVRLQPQPARVLAMLLETPGQIVQRETLQRRLWSEAHVEFDAGINFNVRQVREALRDNAQNPLYIQTVRGQGYRFVGPVETADARRTPRTLGVRLAFSGLVAATLIAAAISSMVALTSGVPEDKGAVIHGGLPDRSGASRVDRQPPPGVRSELLKGRYELAKNTGESLAKAVQHFEAVVRLAPDFAPGYLDLAKAVGKAPHDDFGTSDRERGLLESALALDPGLAEAHAALGTVLFFGEWNWDEARRSFESAIAIDPGLASAQKGLAFYYASRGEHQAAIRHVENALLVDPVSVNLRADLGWFFYNGRRYEQARTQCMETLDLEPEDRAAHACLAAVALAQGDAVEGWRWLREEVARSDISAQRLQEIDGLAATDPASAIREYRTMQAEGLGDPRDPATPWRRAIAHAQLGNLDQALSWLETAHVQGYRSMPFIAIAPPLDPLRSDRRFRDLLDRLDLPSNLVFLPTAID